MKKLLLIGLMSFGVASVQAQTVIGQTSYDVQTNNGSKHRLQVYADGSVSGLWTGSTDFGGALTFTDRGMFYNHRDAGGIWGAYPTVRNEDVRTGFGEILTVGEHEVSIAHTTPDGLSYNMQVYANSAIGATDWEPTAGSGMVAGVWPVAACPAGTDDIYLINTDANPPTQILFSRSDDGGNTWAMMDYTLPYLSAAEGIPGMNTGFNAAETYQIAVHGSDVYVLFGMISSDLVLLHSDANGAPGSWTNTVIHNFPIDNYTGAVQTDIDGDFITDTIETTDGYLNMIMEDDGTLHVFAGYYRIYEDAGMGFWTVDWDATGIWHWKTGMAEAEMINLELDWDNADGLGDPYAGIGAYRTHYRSAGMASMPGAAWDPATGHIYLTYTMPIEYTDIYGDPLNLSAQSYRDIFGVFSADGGATWSAPVNLTNTAETSLENVFTSVYQHVSGGKIHVLWQRDGLPGTAITDLDPVGYNDIMYNEFTPEDFGDIATCNAATGPVGLYADGITADAAVLHWDAVPFASKYTVAFWKADDIATVGKRRPVENMYTIPAGKLDPETTYGFRVKTICYETGEISPYSETVYFTTLPLREGDMHASVKVWPNPTDGNFTVELNAMINKEVTVYVVNTLGAVVYQHTLTVNEAAQTESISLDNAAAGLYNVVIVNGNETISTPVIVE